MLLLAACTPELPVLEAAEFSLEARDAGESCVVCSVAALAFAVLIHNPTAIDGVVETGTCLFNGGELVNATTGESTSWDDLCEEGVGRWDVPAGGTVEYGFPLDWVEVGSQILTVHLTDSARHVLSRLLGLDARPPSTSPPGAGHPKTYPPSFSSRVVHPAPRLHTLGRRESSSSPGRVRLHPSFARMLPTRERFA